MIILMKVMILMEISINDNVQYQKIMKVLMASGELIIISVIMVNNDNDNDSWSGECWWRLLLFIVVLFWPVMFLLLSCLSFTSGLILPVLSHSNEVILMTNEEKW